MTNPTDAELALAWQIAANYWQPHQHAMHVKITAADYDGIRKLIESVTVDCVLEALARTSQATEGER